MVDLPDDVSDWMIEEYDGYEWVSEAHKVCSDYPLTNIGNIIRGKGTESQETYTPHSISLYTIDE